MDELKNHLADVLPLNYYLFIYLFIEKFQCSEDCSG